ncbi:MAG: hypothetical protein R6X02_17080 [Enhygromyxa sp.]
MEPAPLDPHLARSLLRSAVTWLELEAESGRRHAWRAREIGAVAILGGFGGLAARAERLLAEADHVHADDDDHSAHDPSLPHGPELAEMFPPYSSPQVLAQVRTSAPPHISLALDRRFDEAWAASQDDGQREEVVAVRALLGDFEGALTMLGSPEYPSDRRLGPLMVIAIEARRMEQPDLSRRLILEQLGGHNELEWWVPVAAGLLGRVPWAGYPLPET